nr:hypothetical protein HmN_000738400 [Hymenolepis microstoma]
MMEGDSIQLSTLIDHSKGIGQLEGRCDKVTHKQRQSKSTKPEALPSGESIFEMLDTSIKSATSKTEGSENDACLQRGMKTDPNSSVLKNGSCINKGLGVKGSVQNSKRAQKMRAKTDMSVRSLTWTTSVSNEKPKIPEITTVINFTFGQDAISSGRISAEKENSSKETIAAEPSEFVTLPPKQVKETVPSEKVNTNSVVLSNPSKEINTSKDESRLNIIAEETEENQNTLVSMSSQANKCYSSVNLSLSQPDVPMLTQSCSSRMPISNGRNNIQSNHSPKQIDNSTGDEIDSRSDCEDPKKVKGEVPFKSEVISHGSKSDSPKIVKTPESMGMNSSPNERGVERI